MTYRPLTSTSPPDSRIEIHPRIRVTDTLGDRGDNSGRRHTDV
nr:hypothetical protein JVH1_2261 [Rhodococcus sp. JVH1]